METAEFFRKVELFKHLTDNQLERIVALAVEVSFPEGNIIAENDIADGLYVVKSGMAKVSKPSEETAGMEAVLAILKEGDSFGEISLIDGLPRSASVTAMGAMACYFLPRDAFMLALKESPEMAMGMLPALASMVRSADQWVAKLI